MGLVPSSVTDMCEHLREVLLQQDIPTGTLEDIDRTEGLHVGSGPALRVRYTDGATYLVSVHQIAVGRVDDDPDAE